MSESFAEHPMTIGQLRADKSHAAKDWSPRDLLIDTLRAIDKGEIDPDAMIVIMRPRLNNNHAGVFRATYRTASPNWHVTLGIFEDAKIKMILENFKMISENS
jgi:hypothetical protein